MPPLAEQNNNPGDLREAGQPNSSSGAGGFAAFTTPQSGIEGLLNQVQTSINKNPNENLIDFSSSYAPADDGNDVGKYASNLANQLGVNPLTPIGQLSGEVPQFAQAIAHNEDDNTPAASPKSSGVNAGQVALGTGLAGAAGLGSAVTSAAPVAAPAIGSGLGELAGGALGTLVEPGAGTAVGTLAGGALGAEAGNAVAGLFGGNKTNQQSTGTATAAQPATSPNLISGSPDYSSVANAVNGELSKTVTGSNLSQEGNKRGIPDVGTAMAQMGLVPGVDENGNYDKVSPTLLANAGNAQDQAYLVDAVGSMQGQTSLDDIEREAIQEAKLQLGANSPELDSTISEIQKTFKGYSKQHPQQTDRNGRPLSSTQQFKAPKDVLEMEQLAAARGRNWALAPHERDSSQHIKTALRKRLSSMAKKEGVKGLDETFKRMETRFLIKKAIKALPKKASRDHRKEFIHHLVSGMGGALIGKTLGHGLLGGTAGYLLSSKLEKKHYKSLADKKTSGLLSEKAKEKPKNLLTKSPNKKNTTK